MLQMGSIAVFPRANKFTVKQKHYWFCLFVCFKLKYLLLRTLAWKKRLLVLHIDGGLLVQSGLSVSSARKKNML